MDWSEYLNHIESDGLALVAAAENSMESTVPCCPGWKVADVVAHTGVVHRHKTAIVAGRLQENPDPPPTPDQELAEWFRDGLDRLLDSLRAADPNETVFTWVESDQTVGFWYRRMAHETLIHRIDVEQALGQVGEINPALAADGIDEVLTVYVGGYPAWGTFVPGDELATISCSDAPYRWTVRFGTFSGRSPHTSREYDLPAFEVVPETAASVDISGPAADLDLWLWGRGTLDQLTVQGDRQQAERLREICAEDMG